MKVTQFPAFVKLPHFIFCFLLFFSTESKDQVTLFTSDAVKTFSDWSNLTEYIQNALCNIYFCSLFILWVFKEAQNTSGEMSSYLDIGLSSSTLGELH